MNIKMRILQVGGVAAGATSIAQFLAATSVKTLSTKLYLIAGALVSLGVCTVLLVKSDSEKLLEKISEIPVG